MAKNSLRILKDILLRYMKMAKTTRRLSTPWNWAAAQWLRSSSIFKSAGSTQNRPREGRPKKLSARAECHIKMLSLRDRRRSAVSIAAEIEEAGCQPVSAQTIRRTLHQIGVHGCHPRRKPLLKTIHEKGSKTVCWRHVNKAHGLLEPCPMVWWDED